MQMEREDRIKERLAQNSTSSYGSVSKKLQHATAALRRSARQAVPKGSYVIPDTPKTPKQRSTSHAVFNRFDSKANLSYHRVSGHSHQTPVQVYFEDRLETTHTPDKENENSNTPTQYRRQGRNKRADLVCRLTFTVGPLECVREIYGPALAPDELDERLQQAKQVKRGMRDLALAFDQEEDCNPLSARKRTLRDELDAGEFEPSQARLLRKQLKTLQKIPAPTLDSRVEDFKSLSSKYVEANKRVPHQGQGVSAKLLVKETLSQVKQQTPDLEALESVLVNPDALDKYFNYPHLVPHSEGGEKVGGINSTDANSVRMIFERYLRYVANHYDEVELYARAEKSNPRLVAPFIPGKMQDELRFCRDGVDMKVNFEFAPFHAGKPPKVLYDQIINLSEYVLSAMLEEYLQAETSSESSHTL